MIALFLCVKFYTIYVLSCFSRVWLCDHLDYSPPGSSVHEVFQARRLEWVAISFSRGSSRPRDRTWGLSSPALAGRFFTTNAMNLALYAIYNIPYYIIFTIKNIKILWKQFFKEQMLYIQVFWPTYPWFSRNVHEYQVASVMSTSL